MTRRAAAVAVLACSIVIVACATAVPGPSEPAASATETRSGSPSASAGVALPEPGHGLDADAILAAMRDSRRPGGVPDEIETTEVAARLAETIWTFDGEPWATTSAGGSCGPDTCTLEVAGAGDAALGEDLWVFAVTPASGDVELVSAELGAVPSDVVEEIDRAAQAAIGDRLDGLALTYARWAPPPDDGQFELSYRTGDEEGGACGLELTFDAVRNFTLDERVIAC